jgi:electron transport complex protein RnfC
MSFISTIFRPLTHVPARMQREPGVCHVVEPDQVVIPLEYPGQILYKPTVQAGDNVKKNQIIGRSGMGNCVHASVSGMVREIKTVWTARGFNVPAVVIDCTDDDAIAMEDLYDQYGIRFEAATRIQKMKAAGVISPWTLPGRFHHEEVLDKFPEVQHIVIKGINEEPSIFTFEMLLRENPQKVMHGIRQLGSIAPSAEIWMTVPRCLAKWAGEQFAGKVRVVGLSDQYRSRIERLVVPRVTGVAIPNTAPYRSRGVAVLSVEYLLGIVDALENAGPFIVKHLTVAGTNSTQPTIVAFPIGTTVKAVLKSIGLDDHEYGRILVGGPMKGTAQFTNETPLTKSSHGLYLVSPEAIPAQVNLTCINCGRCARACPVKLQVHLIGRHVEQGMLAEARNFYPEACNECGLCGYVCPAHRPLVQLIKMCNQPDEIAS